MSERKEGFNMRVQHEVKFRLHALKENLDRDPNCLIEVYDGGELDVGYVYMAVKGERMIVDARELHRALKYVLKWSKGGG